MSSRLTNTMEKQLFDSECIAFGRYLLTCRCVLNNGMMVIGGKPCNNHCLLISIGLGPSCIRGYEPKGNFSTEQLMLPGGMCVVCVTVTGGIVIVAGDGDITQWVFTKSTGTHFEKLLVEFSDLEDRQRQILQLLVISNRDIHNPNTTPCIVGGASGNVDVDLATAMVASMQEEADLAEAMAASMREEADLAEAMAASMREEATPVVVASVASAQEEADLAIAMAASVASMREEADLAIAMVASVREEAAPVAVASVASAQEEADLVIAMAASVASAQEEADLAIAMAASV